MSRTLVLSTPKLVAVGVLAAAGLTVAGAGVYAGLTATAVEPQQASSGTLKLVANDVGVGFSQSISNLAPGDRVIRYVTIENTGSLAAKDLTYSLADSTPTRLSTDATQGLGLNIRSCPTPWNTATGACTTTSGGSSGQGYTDLAEANVQSVIASSPRTVPTSLGAPLANPGQKLHLVIEIKLPEQNEETVNGVLPPNSIQGLTANLTWTFKQVQRTASTTMS